MNQLMAMIVFLTPTMSFAFMDFLSSGQCSYPQENYPIEAQDEQHGKEVYARELARSRTEAERLMPEINSDLQRARKSLDYYFPRQWADAMITHMDNGLDCCESKRAVASQAASDGRKPAGTDVIDNSYEVVDPTPIYDEEPAPPAYDTEETTTSTDQYESEGGLCLQTGFAASREWNQQACKNGGRIDPEVCGDSSISKYPRDYKQCVEVLDEYYRLSYQKRRLSSEIQAYNSDIDHLRGGRGEAKPKGGFLGQFLKTVGPFLLVAYLAKQSEKSVRHQYQDRGPRYSGTARPSYGRPNSLSGRYSRGRGPSGPPPPHYGEDFGYPLQNGGILGQMLPALLSGGFGCSEGTNGAGFDLGSLLSGGRQSGRSRMPPYAPNGLSGRHDRGDRRPYDGGGGPRSRGDTDAPSRRGPGDLGQTRRDAFFYSRMRESEARRERIWANDVYSSLGPVDPWDRGQGSGSSDPQYAPGMEMNSLLQSLLGGKGRATFTLDAYTGY